MKLEKHACVEEAKLIVFFCLFFCVIHKHVACLPWGLIPCCFPSLRLGYRPLRKCHGVVRFVVAWGWFPFIYL